MRSNILLYRNLIFITIILCACARKHTPVAYDDYAPMFDYTPKEKHYKMSDSVTVSINNPERYGDELALEITVKNNSQEVLELDPSVWQYLAYSSTSKSPKLNYIVNPSIRILEIREDVEARKGYWWKRSIGTILMVSAAAVTHATLKDFDEEAGKGLANAGVENMEEMTEDAKEQKEANKKLTLWEKILFMPCNIQPGEIRAGMVFFKVEPDAVYYDLFIAMREETITHRLNQNRFE